MLPGGAAAVRLGGLGEGVLGGDAQVGVYAPVHRRDAREHRLGEADGRDAAVGQQLGGLVDGQRVRVHSVSLSCTCPADYSNTARTRTQSSWRSGALARASSGRSDWRGTSSR